MKIKNYLGNYAEKVQYAYKARLPGGVNNTSISKCAYFIILHPFFKKFPVPPPNCIFFKNMQFFPTKSRLYIIKDKFAIEVSDDIR